MGSSAPRDVASLEDSARGLERVSLLRILDSVDDAVLVVDPSSDHVIACNAAAERLFGYEATGLAGLSATMLHVDPASQAGFLDEVAQALERDGTLRTSWEMRHRSGHVFQALHTVLALWPDKGWRHGIVHLVKDLSAEAELEHALRENEEKLQAVLQSTPDLILVFDRENRYRAIFTADDALLVRPRAELLGRRREEVLPAEAAGFGRDKLLETIDTGTPLAFEHRVNLDGEPRWFLVRTTPISYENEPCALWVSRDITDRKHIEFALEHKSRALATLSAANRAIIHATSEEELLEGVCRGMAAEGAYCLVWVGLPQNDERKSVRIVAAEGPAKAVVPELQLSWDEHDPRGQGPTGIALRAQRTVVVDDAEADPRVTVWRETARRHGIRSSIALPFEGPREWGVLHIYAPDPHIFDEQARELLEGMAADIGFGLRALHVAADRELKTAQLEASENRYRALYDHNPTMYMTVDTHGRIQSANRFGAAQLGYEAEDLKGRPVTDVFYDDDRAAATQVIQDAFDNPGSVQQKELRKLTRHGRVFWVQKTARAIETPEGFQVLVVSEDITKTRELSERLSYQASHDPLTGLYNRREFERCLEDALHTARRDDITHALFYIDLDQFKVVNDTCGHIAGDELLRQLSHKLEQRVRRGDTLARLGGDEFGVLAWNCAPEQAERVAGALMHSIRELHFVWSEQSFRVGASIGVVRITSESLGAGRVLGMADEACYAAKDLGRDRIHTYEESDSELARRHGEMLWVSEINRAMDGDRLCLMYQPIVPVDPQVEEGLHFEILLRMIGEDGRLVPPGSFLPAAERFNLIQKLDLWVVQRVIRWLRDHPRVTERLHICAINLSGASLGNLDLLAYLTQELGSGGLTPNMFCFEVTETAAIASYNEAFRFISRLADMGGHFALDDFGSGLSSFGYLRTLPVDYLKIDGVFVKDIAVDPVDYAMVKSIHDIGRVLGKKTIAEFVESAEILEKLREIGVDYAQGYGVAAPRPLEELIAGGEGSG